MGSPFRRRKLAELSKLVPQNHWAWSGGRLFPWQSERVYTQTQHGRSLCSNQSWIWEKGNQSPERRAWRFPWDVLVRVATERYSNYCGWPAGKATYRKILVFEGIVQELGPCVNSSSVWVFLSSPDLSLYPRLPWVCLSSPGYPEFASLAQVGKA